VSATLASSGTSSVASVLATFAAKAGFCSIHSVCGGGSGALYSALAESEIPFFFHGRREDACVYAAAEASLATGRPALVCVTSGEAVCNAAAALPSARAEGASILLCSGYSNPDQIARAAIQPTSLETLPADFYRSGALFDCARVLAHPDELRWFFQRLNAGFQRPTGFCAHLAVPRALQSAPCPPLDWPALSIAPAAPSPHALAYACDALTRESFALLVGFGARRHAKLARALVAAFGVRALTTPRGKGIVPGPSIGLGGTRDYYPDGRPARLLVLGSRLGEASTGWDVELLPERELLHVDLDSSCFGQSYAFPTYGIQAEIGLFIEALLLEQRARAEALWLAESA
jgi:thiamine pyrophosphate-dependent acetolactate synthase large subunit-like protein